MKSLSIQLPFECPYPNPFTIAVEPVFPGPAPLARWLFGPTAESFKSVVGERTLSVNGVPAGNPTPTPTFTRNSCTPLPYPNGLVSTMRDSASQTLIFAYEKNQGATTFVGGALNVNAASPGGSGILTTNGGGLLFSRRGAEGSVNAAMAASEIAAIDDNVIVVALVDDGDTTRGYLHTSSTVVSAVGDKIPLGFVSVGNVSYATNAYRLAPKLFASELYAVALPEADVRAAMAELHAAVKARPST